MALRVWSGLGAGKSIIHVELCRGVDELLPRGLLLPRGAVQSLSWCLGRNTAAGAGGHLAGVRVTLTVAGSWGPCTPCPGTKEDIVKRQACFPAGCEMPSGVRDGDAPLSPRAALRAKPGSVSEGERLCGSGACPEPRSRAPCPKLGWTCSCRVTPRTPGGGLQPEPVPRVQQPRGLVPARRTS